MPHQTENDATFAKKGDTPSILAVGDTIQKCIIFIPKEASVTTSGDTIILSNWLETIDIRKPNDTLPGDTTIADGPIWTYTDSLQIRRAVDSVLTDTLVLSYDYFCTVLMEYSTSRVIIIKSDTSGTARNNGDDYTPRIHNIYPNPNSDYIDMQIDGRGSSSTVTIYTQMGVKISETTVSSSEKLSRVSTSGLAPGMYMAVVKTAKGKTSKNFVVHRWLIRNNLVNKKINTAHDYNRGLYSFWTFYSINRLADVWLYFGNISSPAWTARVTAGARLEYAEGETQ